jgi:hypothetical protein
MFDISGTMWLVTIMFVYGLKSVWLPWLWPTFNQIFLMIFLSAWLRRSNVTTGAQWIGTRFGTGTGARLSHTIVVIFAIVGCLGFMAYAFIGLGKFVQIFIPWETISPYVPFTIPAEYVPHVYGLTFTIVAVFYTILGGMRSIVLADLVQYAIMTISAVIIGGIAMAELSSHPLAVPAGWHSPFLGWNLGLDWKGIIDGVNDKIAGDQFSLFTIIMMLMLFKGIGASAAGPAVGLLGTHPRKGGRPVSRLPGEPQLQSGHGQRRRRHDLADVPRAAADVRRAAEVVPGGGRRRSHRGNVLDSQEELVRPAGQGACGGSRRPRVRARKIGARRRVGYAPHTFTILVCIAHSTC